MRPPLPLLGSLHLHPADPLFSRNAEWDGVATRQPKPKRSAFWNRTDWRTRKPRSQRATAAAAAAADGAAAPDAGGQ